MVDNALDSRRGKWQPRKVNWLEVAALVGVGLTILGIAKMVLALATMIQHAR